MLDVSHFLNLFLGHDTWDSVDDLPNTVTTYLVRRLSLLPDVRYYVNVIAYGFSGIHHTESSDGFYVDNMKPKAGSIFDGTGTLIPFYSRNEKVRFLILKNRLSSFFFLFVFFSGLHDLEYQNKSDTIGATWHGFSDSGSGVKKYFWCVGNTSSKSECNVKGWDDVGIHTSVSRMLSNNLTLGKYIRKSSHRYTIPDMRNCSTIFTFDHITYQKGYIQIKVM